MAGCVYEAATNFNPLANDDDGSCEFEEGGNNDCPADLDQDGTVHGRLAALLERIWPVLQLIEQIST